MITKTALIFSAGFGTRMGELGKYLPKPLWPYFDVSPLSYLIQELNKLGFEKIFINAHHNLEAFLDFKKIAEKDFGITLEVLVEEKLLGQGGTVHKLLEQINEDYLFVLNAEPLCLNLEEVWNSLSEKVDCTHSILSTFSVPGTTFNKFKIEKGILKEIIPGKEKNNLSLTYGGVGLLNSASVRRLDSSPKFFDSVANFKRDKILIDEEVFVEGVDLGEKSTYVANVLKVFKSEEFMKKLANKNILSLNKLNIQNYSYNSDLPGCLNFGLKKLSSNIEFTEGPKRIILSGVPRSNNKEGIYYNDHYSAFS